MSTAVDIQRRRGVRHALRLGRARCRDQRPCFYCRNHPGVLQMFRAEVPLAAAHGANQYSEGLGNTNCSDANTATYALRRLKRDHPELAERVVCGELSPNAATIEAGFRKRTFIVSDVANCMICFT